MGGERICDARADKGQFFAPAVKAGAGLSHIVSKDSRVIDFPFLSCTAWPSFLPIIRRDSRNGA